MKKVFLKVSQNSQESTCARVSFIIKLQTQGCNFIKKETLTQVLSCEWFYKICKKTPPRNFLTKPHPTTTSGVVFNNRFPFKNFLFMICLLQVQMLVMALSILIKFIQIAAKIFSFVSVLFFSLVKKYNFSVSIRCCVHISIVGLNYPN